MTPAEASGWEYLRVIVNDIDKTQRDVAIEFGVVDSTVRRNYKKILKDNGLSGKSTVAEVKRLLDISGEMLN